MDPLSDVIALLRPGAAMSKPISGRGRWGVRYAAHNAPGFTIILDGECWLSFDGDEPMRVRKGDFLLLPSTPSFTLSSHPGIECTLGNPMEAPVRHGEQEGDPDFVSLGGTFRIEQVNAPLLLALLPSLIYIPASGGRSERLSRLIELIMDECGHDDPGKEMVLHRLLEVLLVEALRWRGIGADDARAGLLNGMRDPLLARVLRTMHADVRANWTVAALAKIAGLSRSAFAARFGEVLGCGPIEYLARWRMALAKDSLLRGAKTLDRIADEIGYESASAFSTAFRKRLGISPGKFARASAEAATA
ncbi:AraC family transcriptional regulator [Sphingomonas sp. ZT3P38]|uniref:AraC family transcriptional regulator n=1 Tax=Parasphingomonas zepuensis TaxID=3096161 RepID=UPI002FC7A19D